MSNFWPNDLNLSDTQSPREILKVAQKDWYQGSNGVMELVLQDARTKTNNIMIIVHAKHVPSNRTVQLFSIVHRPNNPYPVTIQLESNDLPNFLKKTYESTSPYYGSAISALQTIAGSKEVSNPWVSDTPAEFRKKLGDVLKEGAVKSAIYNLTTDDTDDTDDTGENYQGDPEEN